jgi:excisionase family DNA binding protein
MALVAQVLSMSNRKKKQPTVAVPVVSPSQNAQARGLRVSEAAQYIGATVCFVRALIADREIPALMLGKRWVLLREDLDQYLDAQRRRAA